MIKELSWHNLELVLLAGDKEWPLTVGENLSFELSNERYCTGYKEFGIGYGNSGAPRTTPCRTNEKILSGKAAQCAFCKSKDVTSAAKTGYGYSADATKMFEADHAVYLAYFSDNIIKVGVELWDRREIRTTEQGALACLFIARGNGIMARNLERKIHNDIGLTEWVQFTKKLQELCAGAPSEEKARFALDAAYQKVKTQNPSTSLLETPEFHYLFPRYKLSETVFDAKILYTKEFFGGFKCSGKILGVCGKAIFISTGDPGEIIAINAGLLDGYELAANIGDKPHIEGATLKPLNINRQQGLFDMLL